MPMKLNPEKVGEFDELDINAFTLKPDALIYFAIAQATGIFNKGISMGMKLEDMLRLKIHSVDTLETLCEAQNYLKPDLKKEDGSFLDEYYIKVKALEDSLYGGVDNPVKFKNDSDLLMAKAKVSDLKFGLILKRVFKSSERFRELVY
jgi:hypothetical protein